MTDRTLADSIPEPVDDEGPSCRCSETFAEAGCPEHGVAAFLRGLFASAMEDQEDFDDEH